MLLAQLEVYTSRPIAPTRRVALGDSHLPVDHPPGFGGVLLAGVVARFAPFLDDELDEDVRRLLWDVEAGRRIAQPRLRHRLQTDTVGLLRVRHRLVGDGEAMHFEFEEERGTPLQHVLCAIYASQGLPVTARGSVLDAIRFAMTWCRPVDHQLIARLLGGVTPSTVSSVRDPVGWALAVLDLRREGDALPSRSRVQRAFRKQLRSAHPDHGGDGDAAARIAELSQARRILLGVA